MFNTGNNLDKNASIYAINRHMKKFGITDIKVKEINAGDKYGDGIFIDAGTLTGLEGFNPKYNGSKIVNGNTSLGQPSTCGVLAACGIYVPPKIVEHADEITDERIINARYGVNLSRNFNWRKQGEKLFEFAESTRDDGTYLMDATLTDEELKEWGLEDACKKREKAIERDTKDLCNNIFYFIDENGQERKICIVNHIVNCGAMISYNLGCDYYISVADRKADFIDKQIDYYSTNSQKPKATFTICANPKKGDGKLPQSIIQYCEELRNKGKKDNLEMIRIGKGKGRREKDKVAKNPYIRDDKAMIVAGGPKAPNLFVSLTDTSSLSTEYGIAEYIIGEFKKLIGVKELSDDDKIEFVSKNIESWKCIDAKNIANKVLDNILEVLTLPDIEKAEKTVLSGLKEISFERGK